jgi:hypothetical protein
MTALYAHPVDWEQSLNVLAQTEKIGDGPDNLQQIWVRG